METQNDKHLAADAESKPTPPIEEGGEAPEKGLKVGTTQELEIQPQKTETENEVVSTTEPTPVEHISTVEVAPQPVVEENEVQEQAEDEVSNPAVPVWVDVLQQKMEGLNQAFEAKLKYDSHREDTINQLHAELQIYKDDLVVQLIRPLLMDIIRLIDNQEKLVRDLRKKAPDELTAKKLLRLLEDGPEEWQEILERQGVEPFSSVEEVFDAKTQQPIPELTDDPDKDKRIAKRLKPGYRWRSQTLRQEQVKVYKYTKPKTSKS